MDTLKNSEVAKEYRVSLPTVGRWIEQALMKKNQLILKNIGDKYKIVKSVNNDLVLAQLAKEGKRYQPADGLKKTKPNTDFYRLFTDLEIAEIISDLEFDSLVNLKFSYYGQGAQIWDTIFEMKLLNINQEIVEYMNVKNSQWLEYIKKTGKKANIIDIGCGNAEPMEKLLKTLYKQSLLRSYVPVDGSEEILNLATGHVSKWLDKAFLQIPIQADVSDSNIRQKLLEITANNNYVNLLYMFGGFGAHSNFNVLSKIAKTMNNTDMLIFDVCLNIKQEQLRKHSVQNTFSDIRHTMVLSMLGVDTDKCQTELFFDPASKKRIKNLILDKDYLIEIDCYGFTRKLELFRGQKIEIWSFQLFELEDIIVNLKNTGLTIKDYYTSDTEPGTLFLTCKRTTLSET